VSIPDGMLTAVFENYIEVVDVDGQPVELSLWDTAGKSATPRG
jgi:hypothetical protein